VNLTTKLFSVIISFIFLSVSLYMYAYFNGLPWKIDEVKKEAQSYLNAKYDSKMVVISGTYDYRRGYGALAYPKGEEDIKFYVYYNEINKKWTDYYSMKIYEKQIEKEIKPLLLQIAPHAVISFQQAPLGKIPEGQHKGDIQHFSEAGLHFKTKIIFNIKQNNKDYVYEKLFSIIKLYREKQYKSDLDVYVHDLDDKSTDHLFFITNKDLFYIYSVEELYNLK
jgi:hypothetical protein